MTLDPGREDKILNTIKKLFALAASSNRHEAELALKKAHDLLEKYNLSPGKLEAREERIFKVENVKAGQTAWIEQLGLTVAAYFDCELCFFIPGKEPGFYYLTGEKSAALIADYGWKYVVSVCKKNTARYGKEIKESSFYIYKSPSGRSSYLRKKLKEYRNGFLVGLSLALSKGKTKNGSSTGEPDKKREKRKKKKTAKPAPLTGDFLEGEKKGLAVKINVPIEGDGGNLGLPDDT